MSLALSYFSTSSHKRQNFRKKFCDHKICVFIFFTTFARNSLFLRRFSEIWSIRFLVKYTLLSDLIVLEFSRQIKYSNTKFRENPYIESHVVPYGHTDMTKIIVAFRNFAIAPKNACNMNDGEIHLDKYSCGSIAVTLCEEWAKTRPYCWAVCWLIARTRAVCKLLLRGVT